MNLYIFAIGGSGSRVLRSLTMLLASGIETNNNIIPIIIDPDTSNGDLDRTIDFFAEPENTFSNYWLSAVVLKDKESQFDFLQQTNDNGVMTRPIWELMSRLPMFDNCQNDGLQNTIWFADRVVNIPSSVRPEDL